MIKMDALYFSLLLAERSVRMSNGYFHSAQTSQQQIQVGGLLHCMWQEIWRPHRYCTRPEPTSTPRRAMDIQSSTQQLSTDIMQRSSGYSQWAWTEILWTPPD